MKPEQARDAREPRNDAEPGHTPTRSGAHRRFVRRAALGALSMQAIRPIRALPEEEVFIATAGPGAYPCAGCAGSAASSGCSSGCADGRGGEMQDEDRQTRARTTREKEQETPPTPSQESPAVTSAIDARERAIAMSGWRTSRPVDTPQKQKDRRSVEDILGIDLDDRTEDENVRMGIAGLGALVGAGPVFGAGVGLIDALAGHFPNSAPGETPGPGGERDDDRAPTAPTAPVTKEEPKTTEDAKPWWEVIFGPTPGSPGSGIPGPVTPPVTPLRTTTTALPTSTVARAGGTPLSPGVPSFITESAHDISLVRNALGRI